MQCSANFNGHFAIRSLLDSLFSWSNINNALAAILQEIPIRNPVYLMVGAPLGRSAKGTGIKAIEFALSVCDQVDIYGFTVDPGYLEWYGLFPLLTQSSS